MSILVMGATGTVGRSLVAKLAASGESVKALTRDAGRDLGFPPGVEVREGDFRKPESMREALRGIERAYLLADPDVAHSVVAQLREAGVKRLVTLASAMLDERDDQGNVVNVIESAVQGSGADWTVLRPRAFANNALDWWAPTIRAERAVYWVYPGASLSPIHEADVAAVAAAALTQDGHAGKTYPLTGPESLTQAEQVRIIGEVIGADIAFHELSKEQARHVLTSQHIPEMIVDRLLNMLEPMVETEAPVQPTVEQVTGRPARTFREWVSDNADAFR
ncbi:NAD(P)H-binding protein [Streptomonospora sp. PA3]|uniref:NAD(P)H-binding protein n=1 Tax=Streptomonospora sp. PA3 TaxID=2607326 RepID=UPI0012DF6BFB|nr:NAD(P)H-binding protein [Streptomonospora sp. PA3]MUL41486.1 NAD(P)H-binding protein [Streptomonospora sp. PA3]